MKKFEIYRISNDMGPKLLATYELLGDGKAECIFDQTDEAALMFVTNMNKIGIPNPQGFGYLHPKDGRLFLEQLTEHFNSGYIYVYVREIE